MAAGMYGQPKEITVKGVRQYREGVLEGQAQPVCVNFFDDSDLSAVLIEEGTELYVRRAGTRDWSFRAKLGKKSPNGEHGEHHLLKIPGKVLSQGFAQGEDSFVAEFRLVKEPEVGCSRYTFGTVSFQILRKILLPRADMDCCCIPFPLRKRPETCSLKFRAEVDGVEKSESANALRAGVEWRVTEIHRPFPAKKSHAEKTAATAKYQPFTSSVRSVDGYAEVCVPLHTLFQIEVVPPEGYLCDQPPLQYICCEPTLELIQSLKPVGKLSTRSAVFVQQKAQGLRWGEGQTVIIGCQPVSIGTDGVMTIPDHLRGVLPLIFPGKTFTPPALDLSEGAPPVFTIQVADNPVTAAGRRAQGLLLDPQNKPFVGRRVIVLLPNGDETAVLTDDEGRFEAPAGSTVFAREDDLGMAIEPVLLTETLS